MRRKYALPALFPGTLIFLLFSSSLGSLSAAAGPDWPEYLQARSFREAGRGKVIFTSRSDKQTTVTLFHPDTGMRFRDIPAAPHAVSDLGLVLGGDWGVSIDSSRIYPLARIAAWNGDDRTFRMTFNTTVQEMALRGQDRAAAPLVPGSRFPDFAGHTVDGRPVRLADYRGKVVLVDFWATWCGPCRAELPNVLNAHDRYKSQGFEVIGISLDEDAGALRRYQPVRGRPMPWVSIFDGKGWESALVRQFGIRGIPKAFLLDRDGNIVSAEARGSRLQGLIQQALSKPPQVALPTPTPLPAGAGGTSLAAAGTVSGYLVNAAATGSATGPQSDVTGLTNAISRLAKAAPGTSAQEERQVTAAVAADPAGAARALWSLIDRTEPDRQIASLGRRLLAPVLGTSNNPLLLDVAAWAAYGAGDPAEAYRLQSRAIAAAHLAPQVLGPRRELELGLHARAGLYELATGKAQNARTRLAMLAKRVNATPPASFRPEDTKYLQLLQSRLQTAPAAAGEVRIENAGASTTPSLAAQAVTAH